MAKNSQEATDNHVGIQLWVVVLFLLAFGLVAVHSASSAYSIKKTGHSLYYVTRQFLYVLGCLGMIFVIERVPTDFLFRKSRLMIVSILVLLAGLLIPGVGVVYNQACRWYQLPGGIHFQPAEFAKIVWIIYLSDSLYRRREKLAQFKEGVLFYIGLTSVVGFLIVKEPDFGNAFLVGFITVVLLLAAGAPLRHFLVFLPLAVLVFYFFIYNVEYRWIRIKATYNPWTNPLKEGYHLLQAWTGIGSGGITGQGLGMGIQKLYYIPEPFTDFIVAIIGHELGFVGILVLVLAYFSLLITMKKITLMVKEFRKRLLALGMTALIMAQVVGNMAVVMGILPTKGLPLPFISYGGSSLIATGIAIGIMMRLVREVKEA